jgi:SPOR domain
MALLAPPSKASASETAQMYFELGRFKDEIRAQSIAGRLADAGFHTTVVEKGHLWLNRYQVLVGPYHQEQETAKVERELLSRGYKPRPFERGSRSFMFSPGLMLNGIRLPGGDFTISWESYLTHATVKFIQRNDVCTVAQGRWVQRSKRYSVNEFEYVKNPDGSRTLLEVHFSGLDRALAFGNT